MDTILVDNLDDGVTLFTINRPERLNAISARTAIEIQEAFQAFDAAPDRRAAVITGSGHAAFSSGADVDTLKDLELWRCLPGIGISTKKPIVAAISGWCVGGGVVMTMMSDLAVADESARFSYPEGRLGLTQGMIAGLVGRIPHKAAMELMLLGQVMTAERAYEVGLINKVCRDNRHVEEALDMARRMSRLAPMVLSTLKSFAAAVLPVGPTETFVRTRLALDAVASSRDYAEGVAAFHEKRDPTFSGR